MRTKKWNKQAKYRGINIQSVKTNIYFFEKNCKEKKEKTKKIKIRKK
jgi:hypothetical protein